jgi:hypothetical protein
MQKNLKDSQINFPAKSALKKKEFVMRNGIKTQTKYGLEKREIQEEQSFNRAWKREYGKEKPR